MNGRQFIAHDVEYKFETLAGHGATSTRHGPTPYGGDDQLESVPWESIIVSAAE